MTFIRTLRKELGDKSKLPELRGVSFSRITEGSNVDLKTSEVLSISGLRIAVTPLHKVVAVTRFMERSGIIDADGNSNCKPEKAIEKLLKAGAQEAELSHTEKFRTTNKVALAR